MRLRYIDEVNITFSHADIPACARIKLPPLLLIVLVENAFKHGISYKNASFININITIDHNELTCVVANSRHDNDTQSTERSGIGLNNIIKRMDILFGSSYTLTTDSTDSNVYIVELVIPVTTNK
jgi:LytS/YehU family sensor histidine kinase